MYSPLLLNFHLCMISVWPFLLLERESSWSWSLRKIHSQCHNNPVLVPLRKPPHPVKDLYDGHTYDLKIRVGTWTRMDMVPVEYGTFSWLFHFMMWFFKFITGITFKWDYLLCQIISLLV